jgi:hypothetical protein
MKFFVSFLLVSSKNIVDLKCVIVLFLFLIDVRIVADMEVTRKHPKDG